MSEIDIIGLTFISGIVIIIYCIMRPLLRGEFPIKKPTQSEAPKPLHLYGNFSEMLAPRKRRRKKVRPVRRKRLQLQQRLEIQTINRMVDNLAFRLGVG